MQSENSPKLVELTKNYDYQNNSQIKSEENLQFRVLMMKQYLDSLKSQLDTEKHILQQEKLELYNYSKHNQDKDRCPENLKAENPYHVTHTTPQCAPEPTASLDKLSQPSKQHLKDIEEKCDKELVKLQKYAENLNDLKSYWQFLKMCRLNDVAQRQSMDSVKARRVHEGVPSGEWLDKNRTFI